MQIEKGDYFVVQRGFELGELPSFSFSSIFGGGEDWKGNGAEKPKRYDRSYEGQVFEALEVCGDSIAAKCVFVSQPHHRRDIGKTISFNATEMVLWPVTKAYVAALQSDGKTKES